MSLKKKTLKIEGMHCPSCEILVKDKFLKIKNIKKVKANFKKKEAEIFYQGEIYEEKLNQLITPFGYQIQKSIEEKEEPLFNRLLEFLGIALILILLYLILQEFNLIPHFSYQDLSLPLVFVLGLIASTSTCMATAGALYLSIAQKNRHLSSALSFNLGRILAYFFFGLIFGFLGKTFVNSFLLGGILTLIIALAMVFLGLDMAKVFSWQKYFSFGFTGKIFEYLGEKLRRYPRRMPFFLGTSTYFLPCGFTQSVQVYVMGLGNPLMSAIYMMVFALGTAPLLMAINLALNIRKLEFYQYFLKVMGVLVVFVGFSYFLNFLNLFGLNYFDKFFARNETEVGNVKVVDGKQVIEMTVDSSGYNPNLLVVKKDMPVKWVIYGKDVLGCQSYFVVPLLGINKVLKEGENIIEFDPQNFDEIPFSCSMGMYRGKIIVKS